MAEDRQNQYYPLPLNGRLRTAPDGSQLGEGDLKVLKNMRYGELSPKSISGMTKIDTNVFNATYLKPRAGFHYRKSQPSESHFIVQAWNAGLTAASLYDNTTAIPSAGNFTATALLTDTASADTGKFSEAPDNCMIYANGKDTCVWGGDEYRVASFLVGDPAESISYDYTDQVNNTLSDSNNIATLTGIDGGIDANTMFLLHCDGVDASTTFDDSSTGGAHDGTAAGNAQVDTAYKKFGTGALLLDGTGDYLTVGDHADLDLSGGDWSFDCRIRPTWTGAALNTINLYYQQTDANNYFQIYLSKTVTYNRYAAHIKIVTASSTVVQVDSTDLGAINSTFTHLEFTEDGDNWYIFKNGTLVAQVSDNSRALNYTGDVYLGADSSGANPFKGHMDEIRLSNTPRHIANFSPETEAYSGYPTCYVYMASTRPIAGAKFYVGTANATAATMHAYYWAASWTEVSSLVDNTADTGVTLAKTGTVTFTSTVANSKPRALNGVFAYWYLFTFIGGIDATTTLYYVTLNCPFQQIVDLWDGIPRAITQGYKYTTTYADETTHLLSQDYVSTDTTTFMNINALTNVQYVLVAFAERMAGLSWIIPAANANLAVMTVYYWNGNAWTDVGDLYDGTLSSGKSFGQDGMVTWDAPSETAEFKTSVGSGEKWYYYKIMFSATLSATVSVDMVSGIPAQKLIRAHNYPVMWQDRVWLFNEESWRKNSGLCSSSGTVCVFNGSDSIRLTFGTSDEIRGATTMFTRFGGSMYDNLIVLKFSEIWLVDGTSPADYRSYKIADNYGLVAPGTLKSCDMGYETVPGLMKHSLIWQSSDAIVMFDGNAIVPISADIENYFDRNKTECIPDDMREKSEAFYDFANYEYHWLFASGSGQTTLNKEFVYDLRRKKWFEIDRGTGKYLQIGVLCRSTSGNAYIYGGIDTGYVERLEYGTTFDGGNIISQWQSGDISLAGWTSNTKVRYVRHIAKAKATTTNTVTMTHYGDTISTSTETATFSVNDSTHGLARPITSVDWGDCLFHSFACSLTTNDENVGYEPLGLMIFWKVAQPEALK